MLLLEGDKDLVCNAIATGEAVSCVYTGGGLAGANTTGLAVVTERDYHNPDRPVNLTGVSVGCANALGHACGVAGELAWNYVETFCSSQFIREGILAWFNGQKISIAFYGTTLMHLMHDKRSYHPENVVRFVATNYETGEPRILTANLDDMAATIRAATASAFLPCSEEGYLIVDGEPLTDGGMSNPFPIMDVAAAGAKFILVLMAHGEAQIDNGPLLRYGERAIFGWFRKLPPALRRAVHARGDLFRQQLRDVRAQLVLPIGHPDRHLPPTLIAFPSTEVGLVEQRTEVVGKALASSENDWSDFLAYSHGMKT